MLSDWPIAFHELCTVSHGQRMVHRARTCSYDVTAKVMLPVTAPRQEQLAVEDGREKL